MQELACRHSLSKPKAFPYSTAFLRSPILVVSLSSRQSFPFSPAAIAHNRLRLVLGWRCFTRRTATTGPRRAQQGGHSALLSRRGSTRTDTLPTPLAVARWLGASASFALSLNSSLTPEE